MTQPVQPQATQPKPAAVQVNTATALMGITGSGKSRQLACAAEYVYETFGKVSVLCSTDGGGYPDRVQALIRKGIIRLWKLRTRREIFETITLATKGYMPARINPQTGETDPDVPLVPPITERYTMKCGEGHLVKVVPLASLLTPQACPTCRKLVTPETMQVDRSVVQTPGFEVIGARFFDSLTSMQSWAMHDLGARGGRLQQFGEKTGEKSSIGDLVVVSGTVVIGGNNRGHVGFTQTRAEEWVLNSLSIPHLAIPPIWTMLTLETSDQSNLLIVGPKIAGQARTDEVPQWFGNCLETVKVSTPDGDTFGLRLAEWFDEANRRHLCKTRVDPGKMPAILQDPVGQPFTQCNVGLFFKMLDAALADTVEDVDKQYQDAPGRGDQLHDYGLPQTIDVAKAGAAGVGAPSVQSLPAAGTVTAPVAGQAQVAVPSKPRNRPKPMTAPATQATPAEGGTAAPAASTSTAASARPPSMSRTLPPPPPGPRPPAVAPARPSSVRSQPAAAPSAPAEPSTPSSSTTEAQPS